MKHFHHHAVILIMVTPLILRTIPKGRFVERLKISQWKLIKFSANFFVCCGDTISQSFISEVALRRYIRPSAVISESRAHFLGWMKTIRNVVRTIIC
jgi:hypothetical protein